MLPGPLGNMKVPWTWARQREGEGRRHIVVLGLNIPTLRLST